jgi:hypothetical protein
MTIYRRVRSALRLAIVFEYRLWRSLLRWILRLPAVPKGARPFQYSGVVLPVFLAFIVVSAIEVPVLHLILPDSWETAQFVALALGLQGLLWMVGLLASYRVHPHLVEATGVRVRFGSSVDIPIPWDAVATVRGRYRPLLDKESRFEQTDAGLIAHVHMANQTNVDIVLREPQAIPLEKTNGAPVIELRCYADDPSAFVAAAREHLDAATRTRSG